MTPSNSDVEKLAFPVCPYCGADPMNISSLPFNIGPAQFLIIFCGNDACRKHLSMQMVGVQQTDILTPFHRGPKLVV
jgi:hypothetical protein